MVALIVEVYSHLAAGYLKIHCVITIRTCSLAKKKGPWTVHFTLGSNWGGGGGKPTFELSVSCTTWARWVLFQVSFNLARNQGKLKVGGEWITHSGPSFEGLEYIHHISMPTVDIKLHEKALFVSHPKLSTVYHVLHMATVSSYLLLVSFFEVFWAPALWRRITW